MLVVFIYLQIITFPEPRTENYTQLFSASKRQDLLISDFNTKVLLFIPLEANCLLQTTCKTKALINFKTENTLWMGKTRGPFQLCLTIKIPDDHQKRTTTVIRCVGMSWLATVQDTVRYFADYQFSVTIIMTGLTLFMPTKIISSLL